MYGGIKISRFIVLLKTVQTGLKKVIHPRQVWNISLSGQTLDDEVVKDVAHFFFLFVSVFFIAAVLLTASGISIFTAMEMAIAALSNTGAAFGPIATSLNKLVLITCMLLGRLEIMAILIVLRPEFWRGKTW